MKYTDCPLYGIQSKKMLKYVLHIKNGDLLRQDCVVSMISPYIDKTKKPRLIEPPQAELKNCAKTNEKHYWEKSKCPIMFFLVLREDHILIMLVSIWVRVSGTYTKLI